MGLVDFLILKLDFVLIFGGKGFCLRGGHHLVVLVRCGRLVGVDEYSMKAIL